MKYSTLSRRRSKFSHRRYSEVETEHQPTVAKLHFGMPLLNIFPVASHIQVNAKRELDFARTFE